MSDSHKRGNPRTPRHCVTEAVLEVLRDLGPLTRAEIEVELVQAYSHHNPNCVSGTLRRLVQDLPRRGGKRVRICKWRHTQEGLKNYLRAVYEIGSEPDAPKPRPVSSRQVKRDHYWRKKSQLLSNPFNYGKTNRELGLSGNPNRKPKHEEQAC